MSIYFLIPILDQCFKNETKLLSWDDFVFLIESFCDDFVCIRVVFMKSLFEVLSLRSVLCDGYVSQLSSVVNFGSHRINNLFFDQSYVRQILEDVSQEEIYKNFPDIVENFFSNSNASKCLNKIFSFERQLFWWTSAFRAKYQNVDMNKFLDPLLDENLKSEIYTFFTNGICFDKTAERIGSLFKEDDQDSIETKMFKLRTNWAEEKISNLDCFSSDFFVFRLYQYMCKLDFEFVYNFSNSSEIDSIIGYDKGSIMLI